MKTVDNQNIGYNEENALDYLSKTFNVPSIKTLKKSKVVLACIKEKATEGHLLDILLIEMIKQT